MGDAQEPSSVVVPLTKLAGGSFDLVQRDWLGRSTPCATQPPPSPRAQGKDGKNPPCQDLSHTALCSPHLAVGPVYHRAEEHGEVKVKASPSTASRRPGLPASRLFLPDAAAVLARVGAGHEVRGDCGEWGRGLVGDEGVGEQQAGGWGWEPLLEFLPGIRLGGEGGVPTRSRRALKVQPKG